ncbi:hypothetical protein N7532_003891 [Penicillium argentinense]|uniref:Guanine nucleotide exchange factor n=1 Tax=Penicillium argentinense TaxID=1131581 RepID=A0A9W9FND3_9EURO|nr:uncharacterized protein N7532_003891 [Penicillium argentinense]KAJ5103362.1 hypothetical protein N7532_003891 [Penicillium argentinense]
MEPMEPFPANVDHPLHSKNKAGEPQVQIDELPTLNRTRIGGTPDATSTLRRANTVAQGGNIIKRNLELKALRDRTATTGVRAKDSHELLRKTPLQRSQTHRGPLEARPAPRKAGHFTVGSVGQNGKIFLRVTRISEMIPRGGPVRSCLNYAPVGSRRFPSRGSDFGFDDFREAVSGRSRETGELRIVIDRSEDRPKSADEKTPNTALGVPMPRYRLGSPRFNTEGSAGLQSSVYTRTSMSDNFRNSTLLGGMADPLPTHLSSGHCRDSYSRHRPSFAVSMFSGTAAIDLSRASPAPRNSMVYELKGPVEPSIYETLVSDMDSEAVVRYIPGTKDISAATPARIVAQISSESFMDYELVSDFFLTFRCYLSPSHLLALLLARLKWAINRLQEDGRIIRIRTFAALRHWILNYFVDDFITHYDLRTHFCETINDLYEDVKSRENGGMSDLKILLDLKRCWNGKCSIYWTTSDYSRTYNDPDSPIAPGSIHFELPNGDAFQPDVPPAETSFQESAPAPSHHDRNDSAATTQSIPFSTKSDQSLMALSCSLPPRSPKRFSFSHSKGKGPRPVPLGLTKTTSPHEPPPSSPVIPRHPFHGHGHKRSASFSDSVRDDRLPSSGMEAGSTGTAPQEILDPVSFIRGALYPPAESYMTMMAPESPPLAPPQSNSNPDRRSTPDGGPRIGQSNSGMRTIIGSIKRALHTRNGGQSVSARIANVSEAISLPSRGKTSAMPNNISLGSEFYRERKMAAIPKRPARIDVLCDEALRQYRLAINPNEAQGELQPPASAQRPQITLQQSSPNPGEQSSLQAPRAEQSKIKSGITSGSGSIVIVDDTGFEFPLMTGAMQEEPGPDVLDHHVRSTSDSRVTSDGQSTQMEGEYLLPVFYNGEEPSTPVPEPPLHRPSVISSQRRSYIEGQIPPTKRMSLSLRLRKYASFQSGMSRQRQSMGSDPGKSISSSSFAQESSDKPFGPALRRRPGGNLRQMQFVDDNDPEPDRQSFISNQSCGDSLAETTTTTTDVVSRPPTALVPPNPRYSLIHGGANRNVRRSFEAAIARFAEIPDDDDGGVESTLLKLEGKWSPPSSATFPAGQEQPESSLGPTGKQTYNRQHKDYAGGDRRRQTDISAYSTVGGRLAPPRPYSDSVAESEESYNSIPLLERGLSDESMKPPANRSVTHNTCGAPLSLVSSGDTSELASSHPSIQIIQKTESIQRIPRGSTNPTSGPLNLGQETPKHRSALSSDMSVDMVDSREAMEGRISTDTRSLTVSTVEIPPHPLAHPPSPPDDHPAPRLFWFLRFANGQSVVSSAASYAGYLSSAPNVLSNSEQYHASPNPLNETGPSHVPFVLACESQVLAQQLTLVEMAALSEVDWRDLVEMRWSSGSPCIVSWVQFLSAEERKGIDLVVGRFNLMVKWVVSEIILTLDIHERVRTVIKFIHTAAHARRICNYATMLQIAIALSSSDCSRLQKTWQLIPQEDKRLFKDMECLIQPVRNFHDLRVEMETANLQEGCIPFIGLYVHDLTYNAQKPAQVNSNAGGLLVNFERYRTAARIVKSLLRLIDASTKYRFEPVQGIIERCLWIASLSEEDIQSRSKSLE